MTQALAEIDILNTDIKTYFENSPEYQELEKNINTALEQSQIISIITANDINKASHFIKNFKNITKLSEDFRKKITEPLVDKKKEVDGFFKAIPLKYEAEQKRLEKEILDFQNKQREEAKKKADEERRIAEEKALKEAIEREEKLKKEAKERGEEINNIKVEPAIVPEFIPEEKKISKINTSGVQTRRTKTFKIIDESLVPREYLMPDEKKIRAERMKSDFEDKSNIPGIEFSFDESVV